METSIFMARAIGIYAFTLGAICLLRQEIIIHYIKAFRKDHGLPFITGILTLVLGIIMVLSHNEWTYDWRVVVTIISWITFIKGVVLLLMPNKFHDLARWYEDKSVLTTASAFSLLLGIIMMYLGFSS